MLQTITTPLEALKEMHTVLISGGVIGIALWAQRIGPFEIWERACRSIDTSYFLTAPFDDPHAWRTPSELESALKEVGFIDISTEEMMLPFSFEDTQHFLDFWFGAKNPAAENCIRYVVKFLSKGPPKYRGWTNRMCHESNDDVPMHSSDCETQCTLYHEHVLLLERRPLTAS